ncbi:MAG: hypothetical protein KA105_04055 [Caulobacter sp.]|nr:hypothetical protein [Caulobacter sp.]
MTDLSGSFSTRVVADVLDVAPGTIASWLSRGELKGAPLNLRAKAGSRGSPTGFPVTDVLALALIKYASEHLNAPEVISNATTAAEEWLERRPLVRRLHVLHYSEPSDTVVVRFNDEAMSRAEPAEPGAVLEVEVDLDRLFGQTLNALGAATRRKPRAAVRADGLRPQKPQ